MLQHNYYCNAKINCKKYFVFPMSRIKLFLTRLEDEIWTHFPYSMDHLVFNHLKTI